MTDTTAKLCNTFNAPAEGYDRLMGRYLATLAPAFADAAGVGSGMRLLDVGCGPGGLTRELVARAGADAVSAIDPSPPFVEACRRRNPGVDVREGFAENLPFESDTFDGVLSSLVIGFLSDADAGVGEMARVAVPGGTIAACFWDFAHMTSLRTFWAGAREVDAAIQGEVPRIGTKEGDLVELLSRAGLSDVRGGWVAASAAYEDFEDWWTPFTLGIGPAGAYYSALDGPAREALKQGCRRALGEPDGAFTLDARAWFARGTAPSQHAEGAQRT